jgi:hypothetical protein
MAMSYHVWPSELIPGIGVSQVPLILAWALTIHKAQGCTLEIAEIDAGSAIFECGQTYVALSRVKSLEGLYLSSFDASRVRIHRKVQEFYETLEKETAKIEYQGEQEQQKQQEQQSIPEAIPEAILVSDIPIAEAVLVDASFIKA